MKVLNQKGKLRGEIRVPGDKSISHRSIMFGSLAQGRTEVSGFLTSADCLATMDCFRRMGVHIEEDPADPTHLFIDGNGLRGLSPETDPVTLYSGNSGTTTRILSGILAAQRFTSVIGGDDSVNSRPMKRIMDPLSRMGAEIGSIKGNNCAPLQIRGRQLKGIVYESPVASAQVKSAIMCAGLYADGPTTVIEPVRSRDHSERMLRAFGAVVEDQIDPQTGRNTVKVRPCRELHAHAVTVPGDISSAAYFIAAGLIVPGSEILIRGVGINPTRDGILRVAANMGADITILNRSNTEEPYADLLVKSSSLHGCEIGGAVIPSLIDELPVIAVMAAAAEGTTVIRDAAELRVKESDRIEAVVSNLQAMGVNVTAREDGMVIEGGSALQGAKIRTYNDHRIAMSFAVAALIAQGDTVLDEEGCVNISYPAFFGDLEKLIVN